MQKIGEYVDFRFDYWHIPYWRVSVYLSAKTGKLFVRLVGVNHIFPFLNHPAVYWRYPNDPNNIITDPNLWILGKKQPNK
jgi:hypothetical protein